MIGWQARNLALCLLVAPALPTDCAMETAAVAGGKAGVLAGGASAAGVVSVAAAGVSGD